VFRFGSGFHEGIRCEEYGGIDHLWSGRVGHEYKIWIVDGGDRGLFDHTELEEDRE